MRPLTAYFSQSALENNLAVLKSKSPQSQHCAVIKANAYGHRVENFIEILEKRVDWLAVAIIEEAIELRERGATLPILLLEGVFEAKEYHLAAKHNFAVVVANDRQLNALKAMDLPQALKLFLKVDTGMHRLGFMPEEIPAIVREIEGHKNVRDITLMTHFATADEENSPLFAEQNRRMAKLDALNLPVTLANSAAILTAPETTREIARFGISLYGASPMENSCGRDYGLRPLINLKSRIIHTTTIEAGESVGYGARFVAPEKMPIGVIACGYADGYPREISAEAYLLVGKYRAPIIGRPAMDMMMIDLRNVPPAAWEEEVEIFGDHLPIEQVAAWAGTIPYTIFTHLAKRIHFKVVE